MSGAPAGAVPAEAFPWDPRAPARDGGRHVSGRSVGSAQADMSNEWYRLIRRRRRLRIPSWSSGIPGEVILWPQIHAGEPTSVGICGTLHSQLLRNSFADGEAPFNRGCALHQWVDGPAPLPRHHCDGDRRPAAGRNRGDHQVVVVNHLRRPGEHIVVDL